jgi:hypothetical protein
LLSKAIPEGEMLYGIRVNWMASLTETLLDLGESEQAEGVLRDILIHMEDALPQRHLDLQLPTALARAFLLQVPDGG